MPWQHALTGELLAAIEEHEVADPIYEAAGQSVAWLRDVEPTATILARLVDETGAALARLSEPAMRSARAAGERAVPAAPPDPSAARTPHRA
jgi:hypothetical protein